MNRCVSLALLLGLALLALVPGTASAQLDPWAPGARYREYVWRTPTPGVDGVSADAEDFLRVAGRNGYAANPGRWPDSLQDGVDLILPGSLDLADAIGATVTLEKVLSHEDSRDLHIAFNGQTAIAIAEPTAVPKVQTDYMYHTDVEATVPLAHLKAGRGNRFRLTVDSVQRWGWAQNVFYAVILRVYYPAAKAELAALPTIVYPFAEIPLASTLRVNGAKSDDSLVDYVFIGRDVDWSGTGIVQRRHWQTFRAEPHHTVGRATGSSAGFALSWMADWLPEQVGPGSDGTCGLQVRVRGGDGIWRVGPVRGGLKLAARPYRVVLLEHDPAPANWVTRAGAFAQNFTLPFDPDAVEEARLYFTSWSPCYANGLELNGWQVWLREGPCYRWATHSIPLKEHSDLHALQRGINTLRTPLTPLFRGQMVHGMELQWPGIQVAVQMSN